VSRYLNVYIHFNLYFCIYCPNAYMLPFTEFLHTLRDYAMHIYDGHECKYMHVHIYVYSLVAFKFPLTLGEEQFVYPYVYMCICKHIFMYIYIFVYTYIFIHTYGRYALCSLSTSANARKRAV